MQNKNADYNCKLLLYGHFSIIKYDCKCTILARRFSGKSWLNMSTFPNAISRSSLHSTNRFAK